MKLTIRSSLARDRSAKRVHQLSHRASGGSRLRLTRPRAAAYTVQSTPSNNADADRIASGRPSPCRMGGAKRYPSLLEMVGFASLYPPYGPCRPNREEEQNAVGLRTLPLLPFGFPCRVQPGRRSGPGASFGSMLGTTSNETAVSSAPSPGAHIAGAPAFCRRQSERRCREAACPDDERRRAGK